MINMLLKNIKGFLKYHKAIEGTGLFLCIFDRIFNIQVVRPLIISGFKVHVRTNTPDLNVAITSLYEKEYDYIRCLKPKVIVDAGANIGTSSIYFAKKYPDAQIFAIEPEESNYDLLIKNTSTYENIIPIKAAIWGSVDKRTIQSRFTGHWGYTVSETSNRIESTGQEIECITIESLMKDNSIESIDLLKMDIEGGEKNVLESCEGWIDSVDVMTVELHDRICMGCTRAFYLATKNFKAFEMHGEKVTAYRS